MSSPLAKKLQIKPGKSWLFFNAPAKYLAALEPLPDGVTTSFEANGSFDGIQLFVKDSHELVGSLKVVMPLLKPGSAFWITYPKKSSGIKSDLEMMGNWDEPGKYGYTGVAAAAVDDTWTALRFRPTEQTKATETRNDEIKQNEYNTWIDVENKIVRLPDEIKDVLQKSAQALANYEKLSYSNRKEYVLWVLSAKQEKTREERLVKMVEKLEGGKKNPSEK
ncbi:MAG: YdeI family protein [Sphingobacteriales bacterium]